ncbi:MAG: ABC-2 family transporter protein [Planctomycetes bacterium]|nr:ABC-2 family transporter protein [Planctomycetota bacterium]
MSAPLGTLRHAAAAFPDLLRVSWADMVAYRAEIVIWFLTGTLPIIMMLVWDRVAEAGDIGRFDQPAFAAYFTATLACRQLTGSWVVWEINQLIRTGSLSPALLKPLNPLLFLSAESLAEKPLRAAILVPLVALLFLWRPDMPLPLSPVQLSLAVVAIGLGWLLNVAIQVCFGCLAFRLEQTMGLYMVWFGLWALLSGYLFPLELMPPVARAVVQVLPFRATLGIPVEVLTGALSGWDAVGGLGLQVAWVLAVGLLARLLWRRGVRRYEAYGA